MKVAPRGIYLGATFVFVSYYQTSHKMAKKDNFYKQIIILAIVFVVITSLLICLLKYIFNGIDEYYAGLPDYLSSKSIEESKAVGAFMWEYEVDSVISVDTFSIHPTCAFAEHLWYHDYRTPDSITIDSNYSQLIIVIPELTEDLHNNQDYKPTWNIMFDNITSCEQKGISRIFIFHQEDSKCVDPMDTLKYYIYNYHTDSINHEWIPKDTLTLYLTRKQ